MRLHIALFALIASAVGGCSAMEPKENPKDAQATIVKNDPVVTAVKEEPVTTAALEVKLLGLTDTAFPLPDYKVTQASTDGEFYFLFGENAGSKFDRSGKLISSASISKELQNELPSDKEVVFPFEKEYSLVVSPTQIGVILGKDPSKFADNRETFFSNLPELKLNTKRTQIGIGSNYVLFTEGNELSVYTYVNAKFELTNLTLPTFDAGETIIAAGKNKTALWIATTTRLWAVIENSWQNRPIKYSGIDQAVPMTLAFSGDSLDKWSIATAAYVSAESIFLLASHVEKIGDNTTNPDDPTNGRQYSWAADVRLLSDLYCVQCHVWAEKEVEWIKRLSDIQSRVAPSALTEAKTMPQINSVPANKITLDERAVIRKWLDQQKVAKP